MDQDTHKELGVEPPIPQDGLNEVLRAWSSKGELWEALAASKGSFSERRWNYRDVERRAHRVLFSQMAPLLESWPTTFSTWIDALPAESFRLQTISPAPTSGTSWSRTRRLGWPPKEFVGHTRSRVADTLLAQTLKWTMSEVNRIRDDAVLVEKSLSTIVLDQIEASREILALEPLESAVGIPPTRHDLALLSNEGWPLNSIVDIAGLLLDVEESSLDELANRLLMPWAKPRLFHLGVLGAVLIALRECGASVVSRRPLSAATIRPHYTVKDASARTWDLWFEAAGAWSYYGLRSPYVKTTVGLIGENRALGADIMLILRREELPTIALILECKYSRNPQNIGRPGYHQAVCYAGEIRTEMCTDVTSVVVGPEGIVTSAAYTTLIVGKIGIVPPSAIHDAVKNVLAIA